MQEKNRRIEILGLIQQGDLKPEEGLILLKALEASAPDSLTGAGSFTPPAGEGQPPDPQPFAPAQGVVGIAELPVSQPIEEEPAQSEVAVEFSGSAKSAGSVEYAEPAEYADVPGTDSPDSGQPARVEGDVIFPSDDESLRRMEQLKRLSWIPMGVGTFIILISAYWMYSGYLAAGLGVGFWLSWLPFWVGLAILYLGFEGLHSVWLHVRIRQKPGQSPAKIHISMPLPLGLISWVMRVFGDRIPRPGNQNLGEILAMVNQGISRETPLYVHVNGDDDEQVEVYIG